MITVPVGMTSGSIDIRVYDDSGIAVTGKVASQFPNLYYSPAGSYADVQITPLIALTALTDPFSAGGIKERGQGVYRLDYPDSLGAAEGIYTIRGEASGFHVLSDVIEVSSELAVMQKVFNIMTTILGLLQGNPGVLSTGLGLQDAVQRKRNAQNYVVVKGEAYDLDTIMNPITDITGWNITYTLKDKDDKLIVTKTVGSGITIMNASGGYFRTFISATINALDPDVYDYDIWRTDSGFENQIAFGKVSVERPVK